MIRRMYENDKAMFEKMNKKEIDRFLSVNQLKPSKVHLEITTKKRIQFEFKYEYILNARHKTIRSVCIKRKRLE